MSPDPVLSQIRWHCHRGMRELDLLLLRFFDQHYQHLSSAEQQAFVQLLDHDDPDLLAWLLQQAQPEDEELKQIVKRIVTTD